MKEFLNKVREFQIASGQPTSDVPKLSSKLLSLLRFDLMKEENEEFLGACEDNDIVEVLDSLIDQFYVLAGTINQFGMQDLFEEAFNLVQENNMSKVVDGKVIRNEFGKILKPENFVPVDLEQLFNK